MNTGEVITQSRNKLNWSQTDLADKSGVSRVMIGKYERNDAIPSIDAAKKIADALEVSLDYLVGEGQNASFDKKTVKRLQDIQQMDEDTKGVLFNVIDTYIQNFKTKKAFA
jgi:transcriptional regulator with XRE-family HTH domain